MTEQDVKQISIRLLPDGFSYLNQFHPILPGADFIKRLEESLLEALNESEETEGICSVENVRFFLSPLDIDQKLATLMAQKTMASTSEEEETPIVLIDKEQGIRFCFGIDSHLYHFIQRNWPEINFTHPLFELLEQWVNREKEDDCMVVNAGENYLNLLVFKKGRLYLANRFEVSGTDNILYHLMNCWTQCGLDVIDHKLYLQTSIHSIREQIGQYIKQCES